MSALPSSHVPMRSLKRDSQCDDSIQPKRASIGRDGHITVKHLMAGILTTEGDTDSEDECLQGATQAAPQILQTCEATAALQNRTVGFRHINRPDTAVPASLHLNDVSGPVEAVPGTTRTCTSEGTPLQSERNVGASSAPTQWPNPERAKARLVQIVEKLFGTSRAVSFQSIQSVYRGRYEVPLDDKEVHKLFGTQPALKALQEHCLDVFEISQMGSDFGLKTHKKHCSSSRSTSASVRIAPAPSEASQRQNMMKGIPCTLSVRDISAAFTNDSGRASKVLPPRASEIHPRKGTRQPTDMQPFPRPMSCAPFFTQANSTALATDEQKISALAQRSLTTESPNGANRKAPVFKPIVNGSTPLPAEIVTPARNAASSLKKVLPGFNGGFRKELQVPRAASVFGVATSNNGTRAAPVGNSQQPALSNQSNTASAGGRSQSIFARRPPSALHFPKPAAMRIVDSSVPCSLDQVATGVQSPSRPIAACHGVAATSHNTNTLASSHGRMSVAKGSVIGAKDEGSNATSRLSSSGDKLQHVRHIVLALVQYRHPSPTPLTDVVQVLEQASSNGCGVKDVLGTSTLEFVSTLDGLKIYEERGLVFCAVNTEH